MGPDAPLVRAGTFRPFQTLWDGLGGGEEDGYSELVGWLMAVWMGMM